MGPTAAIFRASTDLSCAYPPMKTDEDRSDIRRGPVVMMVARISSFRRCRDHRWDSLEENQCEKLGTRPPTTREPKEEAKYRTEDLP